MEDMIIELLDEDFITDHNNWKPYSYRCNYQSNKLEDSEIDIEVITEIALLFERNGYSKDSYTVDLIEIFKNPGITCYCLCVAWISDGKIQSFNTEMYSY